jgi:predicted TIM-barrel fold metal-dependent hydrolase
MYARRESISLFCAIYEHEETLRTFSNAGAALFPLFWVRTPLSPQIPGSARGIKLHPYIENYVLEERNVLPTLKIARERNMPVLVHTDDRKPYLSRGRLIGVLARQFPDVTFIMAHCGSYAPGKIETPGVSWTSEDLVSELVSEAIEVATNCPNVHIEVSILASRTKAKLIAQRAPLDKILIGSDFPIYKPIFGSAVFQENALIGEGVSYQQIRSIHANAFRLFGSR